MNKPAFFLGLVLLAGCGGKTDSPTGVEVKGPGGGTSGSGGTGSGGTSGTSGTGEPAAMGTIVLDGCNGLAGSDETCQLVTDASGCVDAPCSKLVVIFSGGDEGTPDTDALAGFTAQGWAAVWASAFETPKASGAVPYLDEQARFDLIVREATTGDFGKRYWTGEHLMLQGISHGATAPVILMARTALDEQAYWHGTGTTAGCFFDGSYDQAATATLLATGEDDGSPCTTPVAYDRWLARYCGTGATASDCDLTTVPAAVSDTIVDVPPSAFAIRDFRMIECGSNKPVCTGDIIPAAPIQALCDKLDGDADHTCTFDSQANLTHLNCLQVRWDDCRSWFDGLLSQ